MKRRWRKTIGVLLVSTSTVGIFIGIFFLIQVWHYRQPVSDKLNSTLNLISSTLQTTDEGLNITEQIVNHAYTSTLSLEQATISLAQFVHDASDLTDSTATWVGENLITTITNTQTAVVSAQASAEVIDGILTTLSNIPFIGISHTPNTTLSNALNQVSTGLDKLPADLKNIQSELNTSKESMLALERQIISLRLNITNIKDDIVLARKVIDKYQSEIAQLKSWVQTGQDSLPKWVMTLSLLMTIIIVWLTASQIGMLLQGIEFITTEQ